METVRLSIERQPGGRTVTRAKGFTREKRLMEALSADFKRTLGTGGSFRDGTLILQGDVRTRLRPLLSALGFTVKG